MKAVGYQRVLPIDQALVHFELEKRFCRDSTLGRSISARSAAIKMPARRIDWLPTKFGL